MVKIKFTNSENVYKANVKVISDNVVELRNVEQNLSGFHVFTNGGTVFGKYEDYITLYRVLDDGYQLSNDGSAYVEEEHVLIPEETLEEIQERKIAEMESIQQLLIHQGVDVELLDGTIEKFTLETNDQLSLNALSAMNIEGKQSLPWHPADESVHSKFYSEEDMKRITETYTRFIAYHVAWFRDLRIYIRSLENKKSVQSITYNTEIPNEYRSDVLKVLMAQRES